MKHITSLLRAHWIALTIFVSALIIHFWLIILHPDSVLYGGPGDHTASLIWLYEKSPGDPWWGHTNVSAFPFGENLWSPTYVLGQLLYVSFWLCSAPFGSGVMGYNLLTMIGFAASFWAFYVVMRSIWKLNKGFAAIGGYIVAFTPFVLSLDAVGHLSYVFAPAASMVVIWLFLTVFYFPERKKWKVRAAGLGSFVGLSWLFDPYFLLFLSLLALSLGIGWLAIRGYKGYRRKELWQRIGLSTAVFLCCVSPLGAYSLVQSQAISDNISYRVSIENDAQQYSALPEDYVLPSAQNPILPERFISLKDASVHGASAAPLYVSLALLFILIALLGWRLIHKQKIEPVVVLCLVASGVMFLFSLPPKIHVGNIELLGPTYLIIQLSSAWRVFARIFIFFYPLLCVAIFLMIHATWKKAGIYIRFALVIGLCVVPFDMLLRHPFDSALFWNVHQSIPSTYADAGIGGKDKLAEYPLREAPHYKGSLYFSAQLSHNAAIVNPMMPDTSKNAEGIRRSLADLHNPQTLGALKFMGVNKVQVWVNEGEPFSAPSGLTLLSEDSYSGLFGRQKVKMYEINSQVRPVRHIAEYVEASRLWDDAVVDVKDTISSEARFRIVDLCAGITLPACPGTKTDAKSGMSIRLTNNSQADVTVKVTTPIDGQFDEVNLLAGSERVIQTEGISATVKTSAEITASHYHVRVNDA